MKPARVAAVVAGGVGIGALAATVKRKLGDVLTWRSRRMWKMTARNAGRYASTQARRMVTV